MPAAIGLRSQLAVLLKQPAILLPEEVLREYLECEEGLCGCHSGAG